MQLVQLCYVIFSKIISCRHDGQAEITNIDLNAPSLCSTEECRNADVCQTPDCIRAANMILSNRNPDGDACRDFYDYACGSFPLHTPIPPDQTRVYLFDQRTKYIDERTEALLNPNNDNAPNFIRQLRQYYEDCLEFDDQVRGKTRAEAERICLRKTQKRDPFVIGYALLNDRDSYTNREKVRQMLTYVEKSFARTIENAAWLEAAEKEAALRKLRGLRKVISFPDAMANPNEFAELELQSPKLNPIDLSAVYYKDHNLIHLPIGIIGFPFYRLGLEALNFAALGTSIGHELEHMFDLTGVNYDEHGAETNVWGPKMKRELNNRAKCFATFYNQFTIKSVNVKINGKRFLNENLADNVGLRLGLEAYRQYVHDHGHEQKLPGLETYDHEKLFFLAYANEYCQNAKPEFYTNILQYCDHVPSSSIRVNAVVMNSYHFTRIWGCAKGSPMNPRGKKCDMWL